MKLYAVIFQNIRSPNACEQLCVSSKEHEAKVVNVLRLMTTSALLTTSVLLTASGEIKWRYLDPRFQKLFISTSKYTHSKNIRPIDRRLLSIDAKINFLHLATNQLNLDHIAPEKSASEHPILHWFIAARKKLRQVTTRKTKTQVVSSQQLRGRF